MLKSLIASALLSFSVAVPVNTVPKKLNTPNTLYGMYCFKEDFTINWNIDDVNSAVIYNWNNYDSSSYSEYQLAKAYFYNGSNGNYINIRSFSIDISTEDCFLRFNLGEETAYFNIGYYYKGLEDLEYTIANYFVLYFPTPVYLNSYYANIFNGLFSGQSNSYVTYYNGYYNMNSNIGSQYFDIYGNFVIDNNMFTRFGVAYPQVVVNGVGGSKVIYDNGFKIANRNMLISTTLIPNIEYSKLGQMGTFAYVQPTETNDFADLIFSVMDAPIYYITSLFSFELFGVQFYVAFMSIVTLLLIVVVVRKVI